MKVWGRMYAPAAPNNQKGTASGAFCVKQLCGQSQYTKI